MARLLDDKAAIVTGASQGLGLAIARALAVDGAKVLLVARRQTELEAAAAALRTSGADVEPFAADIGEPDASRTIVAHAIRRFGAVDILVNCAGVFVWQKFFSLTPEDWNRTLSINLTAPFFLTQEAARAMAERERGGSVINIGSIHGSVAEGSVVPHCASKFGLVGLTRACADALREFGIRVNAIAPGAIDADPTDRRGESPSSKVTQADIATLAVYLGSDLARSITGAVIDMHGSTRTVIRT